MIGSLKEIAVGRRDVFNIELKHLHLDPKFNERTDFGDLDELVNQIIQAGGIQRALYVRLVAGKVIVTDGERRVRAGRLAVERGFKLPPVPCVAEPRYWSEKQRTMSLLILNGGKPLRLIEQARVYRRLRDDHGMSEKEIAVESGHSKTHVRNCFDLLGMPEAILAAVEIDRISASLVIEIIREAGGDLAAAAAKIEKALAKAEATGKSSATRKHVETPAAAPGEEANPQPPEGTTEGSETAEAPAPEAGAPEGSAPDEAGRTGVDAIKAAPSSSGGGPNQSTGEGGTADARVTKLNKLLESTPREKCLQDVFDLLEVLVDYLENRRPLGDVKQRLLLPKL